MPQYAVIIHSPAPADPAALTPDYLALLERYPAQVEELGGKEIAGFALEASTTATSVRGDVVTDGPFAEAKEVVAGFFVLEAPDLDVALAVAKLNPACLDGGVEVRPLFAWAPDGRA
ncbi:YciI family protein [Herbidospora daliensis]|uniref:YciI family protein n=1 Tax=Herbidospora daliensis TaxID=295585 RepID=UPI0007853099|nr:YciI family protein [Herbidospora daliensis]